MVKPLKPGQKAPGSGQVEIVGPRGGKTGEERTTVKGKPLPPTPMQSRIAADFDVNGGRISEINTGKKFAEVRV